MRTKPLTVIHGCCAFIGCGVAVFAALRQEFQWVQWAVLLLTYGAVYAAMVYDWTSMLIPNWIPVALLLTRASLFSVEFAMLGAPPPDLLDAVLGCILSGAILLIASKLTKGGVGAGDVKLFAAIGFACGLVMTLTLLLLALLSCAVIGGVLVAAKKRTSKDHLPFAPFVWCGFVVNALLMAL